MFEGLSERLGSVFDRLKKRGALSESDVSTAMREVRVALLEADVALPVVKSFIDRVRERAVGQEVIKSVTPGQMVVKIVHDELVAMLGSDSQAVNLNAAAPVPILMVGLQGGGKTTTTAKLAKRLAERDRKKVLMASLDVTRPAAREQLRTLGEQVGVDTLPIVQGETALTIAKRAMTAGRLQGYDVVMLDTAGRTSIDEGLMAEARAVRDAVNPHEVLLVADALTGQDAVTTATNFDERVGITGIILTRVDGDSRGGAALSMRGVTGKPIKALGVGEKVSDLEDFHPERIAGRILGMGDVVSLVEKAAQTIEAEEAEKMAERMMKGTFTLDDMAAQLKQLRNLGGLGGVLGMLPGVGKLQKQLAGANIDDSQLKRQEAIISSMTKAERVNPRVMNASRKRRVAAGSGTEVQDINRLLKSHLEMAKMMKKVGKMGGKGMMKGLMGGGGMPAPGEMPKMPSGGMGGGLGGGMGGMPGLGGPRLPGLGGLPPGFPGKRK
ncbi:signal recognition particle protein [Thalassobaculum sp. OXR-137]|uniref:signal recognition particle protein n=1 Tax=Thalassobaculum sp. OXR-137 TaxID=3100173 RepID=UPI002AC91C40|nr:signal recognition particle protein [Thalassobaculum sp. OXR-137]WPZ35703.1 signal recognition particle protein [Thalassobaculum sp. OXR-137]